MEDMKCSYQVYIGSETEVGLRWKNRNGDGEDKEKRKENKIFKKAK